jgi:hypothetical protein
MNDWYDKLAERPQPKCKLKEPREPKGKGWVTFTEMLEQSKWGEVSLRRIIRKKVKRKEMVCFEGTQRSVINRRLHRQVWYKTK